LDELRLPKHSIEAEREIFNTFKCKTLLKEQRQEVSRKTIKTRKEQFHEILNKYDLQKIKKEIIIGVSTQYEKLSQVNDYHAFDRTQSSSEASTPVNGNHAFDRTQSSSEASTPVNGNHAFEPMHKMCENGTKETETTLHIGGFRLPPKKYCPISKIDISHQNPDSRYLSVKTLKAMYENDRNLFDKMRVKYESSAGRNRTNIKDLCIHLSHQIRDRIRPHNRRYVKYADSFFPYEATFN
jgi:hypothetical protein